EDSSPASCRAGRKAESLGNRDGISASAVPEVRKVPSRERNARNGRAGSPFVRRGARPSRPRATPPSHPPRAAHCNPNPSGRISFLFLSQKNRVESACPVGRTRASFLRLSKTVPTRLESSSPRGNNSRLIKSLDLTPSVPRPPTNECFPIV